MKTLNSKIANIGTDDDILIVDANLKVGDKVFVVFKGFYQDGEHYVEDFAISIYEETIFAIIDFGDCKRIAFGDRGYSIDDYYEPSETETIFANYDDALEYAKILAFQRFIKDETERGNNND